jgi:hypothetical protein
MMEKIKDEIFVTNVLLKLIDEELAQADMRLKLRNALNNDREKLLQRLAELELLLSN